MSTKLSHFSQDNKFLTDKIKRLEEEKAYITKQDALRDNYKNQVI